VHSADARLCRWLLRASDAVGHDTVVATQEAMAEALGVRRTTATLVAQALQQAQVISYSRGKIVVRDRAGLEAAACDCHAMLGQSNWPSELMCTDVSSVGTLLISFRHHPIEPFDRALSMIVAS
jgi:hypothetical protein